MNEINTDVNSTTIQITKSIRDKLNSLKSKKLKENYSQVIARLIESFENKEE